MRLALLHQSPGHLAEEQQRNSLDRGCCRPELRTGGIATAARHVGRQLGNLLWDGNKMGTMELVAGQISVEKSDAYLMVAVLAPRHA